MPSIEVKLGVDESSVDINPSFDDCISDMILPFNPI